MLHLYNIRTARLKCIVSLTFDAKGKIFICPPWICLLHNYKAQNGLLPRSLLQLIFSPLVASISLNLSVQNYLLVVVFAVQNSPVC